MTGTFVDTFIAGLTEPGSQVDIFAAVSQAELRESNGRYRLQITLTDRTGQLAAVLWNAGRHHLDVFYPDAIVRVIGTLQEFAGKPQLNVESFNTVDPASVDLARFVPASKFDPDEMYGRLEKCIAAVKDEALRRFLNLIVSENAEALKRSPAAMKIHHAFAGGLLEHVLSMLGAAWQLCAHYKRLDRDLLIAGCILHDLGKIQELKVGVTFQYTKLGILHGHVPIVYAMIERYGDRIPLSDEQIAILQHLVLSHHGEIEHGAVKLPMTPEAIALSLIDVMDARLEQAWRLIDESTDEFTDYVPSLERRIYCGKKSETETAQD